MRFFSLPKHHTRLRGPCLSHIFSNKTEAQSASPGMNTPSHHSNIPAHNQGPAFRSSGIYPFLVCLSFFPQYLILATAKQTSHRDLDFLAIGFFPQIVHFPSSCLFCCHFSCLDAMVSIVSKKKERVKHFCCNFMLDKPISP